MVVVVVEGGAVVVVVVVGVNVVVVVVVGSNVVVVVVVGSNVVVVVVVVEGGLQSHCGSRQPIPCARNPQSSLITSLTHSIKHSPTSSDEMLRVIVTPFSSLYTNVHPPTGADCNL